MVLFRYSILGLIYEAELWGWKERSGKYVKKYVNKKKQVKDI